MKNKIIKMWFAIAFYIVAIFDSAHSQQRSYFSVHDANAEINNMDHLFDVFCVNYRKFQTQEEYHDFVLSVGNRISIDTSKKIPARLLGNEEMRVYDCCAYFIVFLYNVDVDVDKDLINCIIPDKTLKETLNAHRTLVNIIIPDNFETILDNYRNWVNSIIIDDIVEETLNLL